MSDELIHVSNEALENVLNQTTPPEVVQQRQGPGGRMLDYVPARMGDTPAQRSFRLGLEL